MNVNYFNINKTIYAFIYRKLKKEIVRNIELIINKKMFNYLFNNIAIINYLKKNV